MRSAPKYGSDALIFDMESAIPQSELPKARRMVRSVLEDLGGKIQMFVRINAGPLPGEYTQHVLRRVLGYDAKRVEALQREGAVASTPEEPR